MKTKFADGVSFYTKGVAHVVVNFPEGEIKCRWCRFCRAEPDVGRFWCRLTNDILYDVDLLGANCPIEF